MDSEDQVAVHRTPFGMEPVGVEEVLGHIPHPTLWRDNHERIAEVNEEYHNSPTKLHNSTDPVHVIIHEKPEHRLAVYLKAQGLNNKEVAHKMGWTEAWTSSVTRQPWFRIRLLEELTAAGRNVLDELFKLEAVNSAFKLVDIRDDPKTPKAVAKSACDSLLDRFLGKPIAKVETSEAKLPSTEETRKIDAELKSIDEQLTASQNENNTAQSTSS